MLDKEKEKAIKKYANSIKKSMQELKIYKKQYDNVIKKLSEIEYAIYSAQCEFECEYGGKIIIEKKTDRGAVNKGINPLLTYIDKLKNTALIYYKELGLTAQSHKKIMGDVVIEEKRTTLEDVIAEIERDIAESIEE